MSAVAYRLRIELRRSARFVLLAGVLAGLAAGIVVAVAVGARRNVTAYDRLVASHRSATVLVNPDAGSNSTISAAQVAKLPTVADVGKIDGLLALYDGPSGTTDHASASAYESFALHDQHALRTVEQPKLVAGMLPASGDVDGVFVNTRAAAVRHLHVGSTFRLHPGTIGPEGFQLGKPVTVTVRGIGHLSNDIVAADGEDPARVFVTPAFRRAHPITSIYEGLFVRLRGGTADLPAFRTELDHRYPHEAFDLQTLDQVRATVDRSTRPGTVALVAFALLLGLTALLGTAQAIVRHRRARAAELDALRSVGFDRRQLVAGQAAWTAAVAALVAIVSVPVAIALSGRFPIGSGRIAEPHPGTVVDVAGLAVGAAATFLAVVGVALPGLVRLTRRVEGPASGPERAPRLGPVLTSLGFGAPAAIGVRSAVGSGADQRAVPARSMLVGIALGLVALVGALVFGANLERVVHSPTRYGWAWQARLSVSLDSAKPDDPTELLADRIARRWTAAPTVAGVARFRYGRMVIDGHQVPAMSSASLKGGLAPTITSGREPGAPDEVALGRRTLALLHRSIGDRVPARRAAGGSTSLRIVGTVALPDVSQYSGADNLELGAGAVVTEPTLQATAANWDGCCYDLVASLRDPSGPGATKEVRRLLAPAAGEVGSGSWEESTTPQRPDDVIGLLAVARVPLALAGVLAALSLVLVANVLVVSVRARRRDLAVLKVLGFRRRDLLSVVGWQATATSLLAAAAAAVVGTALGRLAWSATARQVGVVADATTPIAVVALVVVGAVLAANLVAVLPGLAAARTSVSRSLQAE